MTDATQRLVDERGTRYGHPLDNHSAIAALWGTYLARRYGVQLALDYRDVEWMNILQKASRDAATPDADNPADVAGYARCMTMAEQEQQRRAASAAAADLPLGCPGAACVLCVGPCGLRDALRG